jgi:hypothetical protein
MVLIPRKELIVNSHLVLDALMTTWVIHHPRVNAGIDTWQESTDQD